MLARLAKSLAASLAMLLSLTFAPTSHAAPYAQRAPSMDHYIQTLGFLAPTDPAADLSALDVQDNSRLEAFLLEGAEAGAMKGDPVLLAWFAAKDASLAPWTLSNCGDQYYDINYNCPWGTMWQVGLGTQVTDHVNGVAGALAKAHPGASAQQIGQAVLDTAAQQMSFPSTSLATLAAAPGGTTGGMNNVYWLATLMRDMAISSYLEAPAATAWTCYQPGYPSWCSWYRQTANWQSYSDALSETINSWNAIQDQWAAALVPDVIVDDMSPAFSILGTTTEVGKGGWRGHFHSVPASTTPSVTATWTATLPAGTWRVLGFNPRSNSATAPDAEIIIHAADGDHAATLDQSVTGGRFIVVAELHLEGTVQVTGTDRASSGLVGLDAIRFHAISLDGPADAGSFADAAVVTPGVDAARPGKDAAATSVPDAASVAPDASEPGADAATAAPGGQDAASNKSGVSGGCGCGSMPGEGAITLALGLALAAWIRRESLIGSR